MGKKEECSENAGDDRNNKIKIGALYHYFEVQPENRFKPNSVKGFYSVYKARVDSKDECHSTP